MNAMDSNLLIVPGLVTVTDSHRYLDQLSVIFGEIGVKSRIRQVLNYKKPAFWIIIVALVLCVVIAVCFLTNPVSAGVKDISVKNIKDDSLELVMKYYFPSGNYLQSDLQHNLEHQHLHNMLLEKKN